MTASDALLNSAYHPGSARPRVSMPAYTPEDHGVGIVHFGVGAFHRAHQAVFTDTALALGGGDWRILGVNLNSTHVADAMTDQQGRYTLLTRPQDRPAQDPDLRVIGSITGVIPAIRGAEPVFAALADPATRIVTTTITEKAYGVLRATGGVDPDHPAIAHDLAHPDAPRGAVGMIVRGLALRRAAGLPPFTVLCCDNLPENGALLRAAVVDFARRTRPELVPWIEAEGAFPSSMVDRITPAATPDMLAEVAQGLGARDAAAIEAEPFSQWVIEDHFCAGRPAWDRAGVIFVADVAAFEKMKLRMLNGAHSLIAYLGVVQGHGTVRDAMADARIATLVADYMRAAAATLDPQEGVDFNAYAADLVARFANPHIRHETYQIAMDGSQKMPQRVFAPACDALAAGQDLTPFARATAAWLRYGLGVTDTGQTYDLRDPRAADLRAALGPAESAQAGAMVAAAVALPDLMPPALGTAPIWRTSVETELAQLLDRG